MDELARRAIGDLMARVEKLEAAQTRLTQQQNRTDANMIWMGKAVEGLRVAATKITSIIERMAGVA